MREVAAAQGVGFADVFTATSDGFGHRPDDNGCHLNEAGYKVFAEALFAKTFVVRRGRRWTRRCARR